ncbi:hypothetical protein ACFOWU_01095 [Epilithonimonas zeae]|uniref:Uncharacterized protein n=1 Tax=Epilithonimonas zeae TaxID=1416779 RepID=A0A1N6E220_9FLAO|nr:hypothetical protein [Epilithonimonas zeae]SIN77041.1 hypothetical protein SAMN05444409_0228 [Epilithonimonas zeae]
MKRFLFILMFFKFLHLFAQESNSRKCNLIYEVDTIGLSKTGIVNLNITNKELYGLKLSDIFHEVYIQPINVEKSENKSNIFYETSKSISDVNCLDCFGKFKNVKPNKTISYSINLDESKFFKKVLSSRSTKYRFNIWFDTIDLLKNSTKSKCYVGSFTSDKIIYTTK